MFNVQRVRWYSMIATPFLTIYIAGLIFSADILYIIKLFLLACLYATAHTIGKMMFDDHLMTLLPLSVYMATKLWFYVTWLGYIAPTVSTFTTILFMLSSFSLWYCFLKTWRGDPGVIKPTQEQRFRVIITIIIIRLMNSNHVDTFQNLISFFIAFFFILSDNHRTI